MTLVGIAIKQQGLAMFHIKTTAMNITEKVHTNTRKDIVISYTSFYNIGSKIQKL